MSLNAEALFARLRELETDSATPSRYVVAYSGGLDSSVLLHALANLRPKLEAPLLAVHIDHGLHADSGSWAQHCAATAAALGVEFLSRRVKVQLESGKGPEASARDARYNALHSELGNGDWLLSAHHREDQAETLLLNLIRGSGPMGVAGISSIRRFGPGWLVRPLLETGREALREYAEQAGIDWLEDASNVDRRFDRNFLRHDILPRLRARWPDIAARLHRSAGHAGEASQLLANLAAIDLDAVGGDAQRLEIDSLQELTPARQRNLLRYALRQLGLTTPTAMQLAQVLNEVLPARADAQPLVSWPGVVVRRYRNGLYLLPETLQPAPRSIEAAPPGALPSEVALGPGLGVLQFLPDGAPGLARDLLSRGVSIRFRCGGEEFKPIGQSHTRKLKKLLQEEGVLPWMRDRLPLVYAADELIAVGDLWLAADAVSDDGCRLLWKDRPALH